MEEKDSIVPTNKYLRTKLENPLEAKNYMIILGAECIDDRNFVFNLDGLGFCVETKGVAVRLIHGIPNNIKELLEKYKLYYSEDGCVFELEALVLIHTVLSDQSIEECFPVNLKEARKQMLSHIQERNKLDFRGTFEDFDKAVTPFLGNNFDVDRFLDECIFNTNEDYEEDGDNKCLKFQWKTKKDPDTIHEIVVYGNNAFRTSIISKFMYERFHQRLYHATSPESQDGIIDFFYGGIHIKFDPKKNTITEIISNYDTNYYKEQTREATEFDRAKVSEIVEAFQDRELLFKKEKETITTQELGQVTVAASTELKNKAEKVEKDELSKGDVGQGGKSKYGD